MSHGKGCVKKSNSITCEKEYPVAIKHCGSYKVYHLRPSTKCPEAYCFGKFLLMHLKIYLRRVWRYQRVNQNPYIEEQTTQWPK